MPKRNCLLVILILLSGSFYIPNIYAQVNISAISDKLSSGDKTKLKKAEDLLKKAEQMDLEAKNSLNKASEKETSKSQKKYNLKRLEISTYIQNGNSTYIDVFTSNIKQFWKSYKGTVTPQLNYVKTQEGKAADLVAKAKVSRKAAENLLYPEEKIIKLSDAEKSEKEAIDLYSKILYSYLYWPVDYDKITIASKIENDSVKPSIEQKRDTSELTINKPLVTPTKESIIPRDTIKKEPLPKQKKDTFIQAHERSEPYKEYKPKLKGARDTSGLYGAVKINEEQVDMFNKFLQSNYPSDYQNYVINFDKLDYSNVDSLRNAWYRYLYGNKAEIYATTDSSKKELAQNAPATKDTSVVTETKNVLAQAEPKQGKQQKNGKGEKKPEKEKTVAKVEKTKKEKVIPAVTEPAITHKMDSLKVNAEMQPAAGFIFKVQIAACKVSLDQKTTHAIYSGELDINETFEDTWYKYVIGEFNTYRKARELRDKVNIPGAFIVAYLNGKRINISTDMTDSKGTTSVKNYTGNPQDLLFRIQIAASKEQLNEKVIKNIYSGEKSVVSIQEDGWYKYTIPMGSNFKEAKALVEKLDIPGAFITAYLKGEKMELSEAIRLSRSIHKF